VSIRKLPAASPRVETGPTQFGEDWPGVFIRGDNAMHFAMHLRNLLDGKDESGFAKHVVEGLYSDLTSAVLGPAKEIL
jgi:hypothetical protein